jgi:hypothetical protein
MHGVTLAELHIEGLDVGGQSRPLSDQTHVTHQHVPELWQLVDARRSKNASDPRYTWVDIVASFHTTNGGPSRPIQI